MTSLVLKRDHSSAWLFDPNVFGQIDQTFFEAESWSQKNAVTHKETGRGTTLFVTYADSKLVLRHYLRGGLASKLSNEHYLYTGLDRTRSFSELRILEHIQTLNLPAPKPAAAQVKRHGLFYTADILIHQIPNAKDLVSILQTAQSPDFYQQLGQVIARFHQQGVYHADLNIKNILFDGSKFWLIDFDRARLLTPSPKWQSSNLKRLKRSFEKETSRYSIQWTLEDWGYFEKAYNDAIDSEHKS